MVYPWGHERPLNTYTEYFKKTFGQRVQKVTLDAGFTCPNRDGTVGVGGCTYCLNDAFNPSYCQADKSITQQITEGIEFHKKRYRRATSFLAYFQAFSNTHAPLRVLKQKYEEALSYPGVIGLVIGTRPDCVDSEKLDYIAQLSEKYYIIVEYGIESCDDEVLIKINRGHNFQQAIDCLNETNKRGIKCGAHFILGFPGDTTQKIIELAQIISELPLHTIKFHQLQIVIGTAMEVEYLQNPSQFNLFTIEDYLQLMVQITERLNPTMVIERIAAEVPPRYLSNKGWGLMRYDEVFRRFEKMLLEQNTWQGKYYKCKKEI